MLEGQKPTLLIGGCKCAELGELNESLKSISMQFAFKLYGRLRSEGRYFMLPHPEDSKSWREECVKKLSGEEHVVDVTVTMGGNAKPTTWLSNVPIVTNRVCCRTVDKFIQRNLWERSSRV